MSPPAAHSNNSPTGSASSSSSSSSSTTKPNQDWLECAKWLGALHVLPARVSSALQTRSLSLSEFANSLRDGETLCSLANHLVPGCIDSSLIHKHSRTAQKSQLLALNNIRLFLEAAKAYLGVRESDLFGEHMLYDLVDLGCVLRTLSAISRGELAVRRTGLPGFSLSFTPATNLAIATSNVSNASNASGVTSGAASGSLLTPSLATAAVPPSIRLDPSTNKRLSSNILFDPSQSSSSQSQSQVRESVSAAAAAANNSSDDIYYNIVPTESDDFSSPAESNYTDDTFFNPIQQHLSQDNVYDIIVKDRQHQQLAAHHHQQQPMKRDFVMREILNTEENFVAGLNTLMQDFLIPLSRVLKEPDRKCICINLDRLIELHTRLRNALSQACKGGQGRTQRICLVFEAFKVELMKEYAEYFSSIDRSLAKCESLTQPSSSSVGDTSRQQYLNEFRQKLDECRKKSKQGSYKLTDLLRLPYQRILKYHLLFGELLKQTDVEHSAKDLIEQTKASMSEVGNYLNECQRDKENLSLIEQLTKHLILNTSSSGSDAKSSVYSNSLNLNLFKDYGHYIKDDKFMIKSNESSASTRSFFLFEKALIVCKAKGNFYNYKETILLSDYAIEDPQTLSGGGGASSVTLGGSGVNGGSLASSSSSNLNHGGGGGGGVSLLSNLIQSNLASINPNLSSSSINLSSNQPSLYLVNTDNPSKMYQLIFKNKEKKKVWKQCLVEARAKCRPDGCRSSKHQFELANFDRELVKCFICDRYLLGLFYQGYSCRMCKSTSHRECLIKISSLCPIAAAIQSPVQSQQQQQQQHQSDRSSISTTSSSLGVKPTVERVPSTRSLQQQQLLFTAKAVYRYDGRPPPPLTNYPPLVFSPGDLIQVTDDDDDDWWRGFLIQQTNGVKSASGGEGYFLRRHVRVVKAVNASSNGMDTTASHLDDYPWYSPIDRSLAELILNRLMSHDPTQTLFMVRRRQEGGYAISIKYNGAVDHIKINLIDINNSPSQFIISSAVDQQSLLAAASDQAQSFVFSIDQQHNFESIVELVKYYSIHTLKENFPQLDTTLGMAYKQALPPYISMAVAQHDYDPQSMPNCSDEQIELVKSQRYYVLNKELNGWWRVFNQDGLIGYVPGSYLLETSSKVATS